MKAALLTLALVAGFAPPALAQVPVPKFEALVTDLTGTLTAQQQASLEEKLTAFQSRKGAQIAVLMLPTTEPEDIAQFGIRVADAWKVGRKGTDDGLILLVAKDDRALRFEVGYGLEGALPDALTSRIVNDTIAPLFKQGDFYGGINAGLDQAIRVIDGEPLPAPDRGWQPDANFKMHPSPLGDWTFIAFFAFIGVMRLVPNRAVRAPVAALVAGAAAYYFIRALPIAAFAALFAAIFVSANRLGSGGGRWTSRGGGWGGGGFGGGGFSGGGGGSFGGGGASGRW